MQKENSSGTARRTSLHPGSSVLAQAADATAAVVTTVATVALRLTFAGSGVAALSGITDSTAAAATIVATRKASALRCAAAAAAKQLKSRGEGAAVVCTLSKKNNTFHILLTRKSLY